MIHTPLVVILAACTVGSDPSDDPACPTDQRGTPAGGCAALDSGWGPDRGRATGIEHHPLEYYAFDTLILAIDAAGDVVGFEAVVEGATVSIAPTFQIHWYDSADHDCTSTHELTSTRLTGGPFELVARASGDIPEARTETWNAWTWTVTRSEHDCSTHFSSKDRSFIESFVPSPLYVAIGPPVGKIGAWAKHPDGANLDHDVVGILGLWDSDAGTDPITDRAGGRFVDHRVLRAYEWDGTRPYDGTERGKYVAELAPGDQVLRNALVIDVGGWTIGL